MVADLAVVWGIRELLSLLGLTLLVGSTWYYGRKWDEEGSAAFDAAQENAATNYSAVEEENGMPAKKFVTNADGSRDAISVATETTKEIAPVPLADLEKALPIPYGTIAGLLIWAMSFLFEPASRNVIATYAGSNICFIVFLPVYAFLEATLLRTSTISQNLEKKKMALSIMLLLVIVLMVAGIYDRKVAAPWYFCFFGATLLFLSYHIIRRSSKMGITWEMEGKPARGVASQHLGAMTMILAIYLLWIGTNAIEDTGNLDFSYVPVYFSYRAWLVFVAVFVMIIPANLALDYSFDRGSHPVQYGERDLFRLDGRTMEALGTTIPYFSGGYVATYLETPWPALAGWFLFGLCAFMPFGAGFTIQKFMTMLVSYIIGFVRTIKVQSAYWTKNMATYKRYSYIYYAFMVVLSAAIGVDGKGPLISSMVGVFCILCGQHVESYEKKKGKRWIHDGEPNGIEVAFSYGNLLHVFGWLLLCIGMSIPMDS